MKTLEELKQMFVQDRFVKLSGIEIESVSETGAVCSVEICDEHLNALDTPQGGLIYTLADFTFAVAANAQKAPTVTLSGTMNYLNASHGKKLIATAEVKNPGKHICVYETTVVDDAGKKIAVATFTGYIKN
jgi:uncharacterized domain 1